LGLREDDCSLVACVAVVVSVPVEGLAGRLGVLTCGMVSACCCSFNDAG
jgi:hypothetical protein